MELPRHEQPPWRRVQGTNNTRTVRCLRKNDYDARKPRGLRRSPSGTCGRAVGRLAFEDRMKGMPPLCAVSAVGLEPIQRSGCSVIPLGASTKQRAHRNERELPVCWCWLRNALPITGTAGADEKLSPGLDPSKPRIMMFGTSAPLAPYGSSAVPCARTPDPTLVPHISICPYRSFRMVFCEGSARQRRRKTPRLCRPPVHFSGLLGPPCVTPSGPSMLRRNAFISKALKFHYNSP